MADRDFNASLLVPNLAVLLLVAIGLLSERPPLVSRRPDVSSATLPTKEALARLWQDPFGVIGGRKAADLKDRGAPAFESSLNEAAAAKAEGRKQRAMQPTLEEMRVLILPVLLSGKSGPEEIETRLRTRYAVLSALGRAQFVPTKGDRIEFFGVEPDRLSLVVPFEEFEMRYLVSDNVDMTGHENNWLHERETDAKLTADKAERLVVPQPYDRVYVLWLQEEVVMSAILGEGGLLPAARFDQHLAAILKAFGAGTVSKKLPSPVVKGGEVTVRIETKVIGPSSTDVLASLLERSKVAPTGDEKKTPEKPTSRQILSPRATAAPAVLQISLSREPGPLQAPPDRLNLPDESTWQIARTIGTDDQLVDALLGELKNRGIEPGPENHVVLVGEWDTVYSRGLGRTFAAHLNAAHLAGGDEAKEKALRAKREVWAAQPSFLHEFSYLRGLDGRVSEEAGEERKAAPKTKAEARAGDASGEADLDRAEGQAQFDYLRRLEADIRRLQLKLSRDSQTIRAIGVIGSDVYDKLLVLRALHASFPRAVFFTTDLSALYLDRSEGPWTSNLLIASPFGLSASRPLQHRIPPFRDSYQTAMFLTVLHAVGVTHVGAAKFSLQPDTITPRLFELGRTGYVDLSPQEKTDQAQLHPPVVQRTPRQWFKWQTLLVGALLFAVLAVWISLSFSDPLSQWECRQIGFGLLWVSALIGLVTLSARGGEALIWSLGVAAFLALVWTFFEVSGLLAPREIGLLQQFREAKNHQAEATVAFLLLTLGGAVAIGIALTRIKQDWNEEPFAWFEGFSVWPTEIVRLLAAGIAVFGVVRSQGRLNRMKVRVARLINFPPLTPKTVAGPEMVLPPEIDWAKVGYWRRLKQAWLHEFVTARNNSLPHSLERAWWGSYCAITMPRVRFMRVIGCVIGYLLLFGLISAILGTPLAPARGEWSRALDIGIFAGAIVAYCYLLFFVFDATVLAAALIGRLVQYVGHEQTELEDFQALYIINDLSTTVARLIYLPFSVLFMLMVSRNSLFDAWGWPPILLGLFASGLVVIVVAALLLQQRARKAKYLALEKLDASIVETLEKDLVQPAPPPAAVAGGGGGQAATQTATSHSATEACVEHRRELRKQIEAFDGFVFQSWHQNPIFRAIMIPLGGIGSLQLLERFSTIF